MRLVMARDKVELLEMGARIKELRRAHGYKQQWIADQIGVELRTYQFWQAGGTTPEQENLEKLAELFHVTPKFILHGPTPDLTSGQVDRLTQIEAKLDLILEHLGISEAAAQIVGEALAPLPEVAESQSRKAPARPGSRKAASGNKTS